MHKVIDVDCNSIKFQVKKIEDNAVTVQVEIYRDEQLIYTFEEITAEVGGSICYRGFLPMSITLKQE